MATKRLEKNLMAWQGLVDLPNHPPFLLFQFRGCFSILWAMPIIPDEFDRYVLEAMESIDPAFRAYLDQVPVVVEDKPEAALCQQMRLADNTSLLGLYRGVPLNRRSVNSDFGPDQIVLYRENLLAFCRSRRHLAQQIRKTLIHELAHYLGFSEEQIRQLRY